MTAFFYVLFTGGWRWGDAVGPGSVLHSTYIEATTATFAAIVACQMGTAVAARTSRAALSSIGWASNRLLLIGLIAGVAFAAVVIYLPLAHQLVHTAPLGPDVLLVVLPFPFVVWGVDELYRASRRRARCLRR
jgi:magnesium-transporting ATPase (P-type)